MCEQEIRKLSDLKSGTVVLFLKGMYRINKQVFTIVSQEDDEFDGCIEKETHIFDSKAKKELILSKERIEGIDFRVLKEE